MTRCFRFPCTGVDVEREAVLLAIDDVLLPLKRNVCTYLSRPEVRPEPVLRPSDDPDSPDSHGAHFYGTVLQEDGRFRMWYYACHRGANPDWPAQVMPQVEAWGDSLQVGPLCYAESSDGMEWTKPKLGQVLFKGSRDNNVLALPDPLVATAMVMRDGQDADPQRRYKLVYNYYDNRPSEPPPTLRMAVSPDGLAWSAGPRLPVDSFIEHSSFYKFNGLYIVNGQKINGYGPSEGGHDSGRQGYAHVSPDFDHWLQEHVESFLLPEPPDARDRGGGRPYDQVHLGVGAVSLGNVLVGLYGLWHNRETFGEISADLGLVVSNDGLHFREPVKGRAYIRHEDSPVTPVPGKDYNTILCQGHGILNVGDQTRIYHGRWRNVDYPIAPEDMDDYYSETALATLPLDRWGALGLFPNAEAGAVWSAPVTLPEARCAVHLNADGADGMSVEVSDERFALIDGLKGAVGKPDGLRCSVEWTEKDLPVVAGKTVRFRIRMTRKNADPRLYAVYLSA